MHIFRKLVQASAVWIPVVMWWTPKSVCKKIFIGGWIVVAASGIFLYPVIVDDGNAWQLPAVFIVRNMIWMAFSISIGWGIKLFFIKRIDKTNKNT